MRPLVLLILLVLGMLPWSASASSMPDAWATWRTPWFQTLDGDAGLHHATATAIVQSSDGLMWIGTRGGLARYDGQRLRVFRQTIGAPGGLPDNYIRSLLELPRGGVLVGTNVGGLVRFDPSSNRFVPLAGAKGVGLGTRIMAIEPDGRGGAFIASDQGVFRYDAARDRVDPVAGPGNALAEGAFAVHRDADGTLYAGGENGLFVLRRGKGEFAAVATPDIGDVWAITRDMAGRLWVGTGSHGIFVQLPGGRFVQPAALSGGAPQIAHRTIRAFAIGPDGVVWVGTDGVGVLRIATQGAFSVRSMRNIQGNPGSLAGDTVRDLTIDRTGRLWAATEVGASHTDPRIDGIFTIGNAMPNPRHSLSDRNVRGLMVDRRDRIWVGMSNGMIDRIDRADGVVRHLRLDGAHAGQDIKAFAENPDGTILAGGRGIVQIDPETLAERSLPVPDLGDLPVISMLRQDQRLLIGTYKGLFVWDERTRRMQRYRHVPGNNASLANNEVINIVAAPGGGVWLATPRGINWFDPATGRFVTYRNDPADPASLPQNYTGSILPLGDTLWVGTYGGVARGQFRGQRWRFHAINEARGLANDNVAAVQVDHAGRIWATGASGVSVIDPRHEKVLAVSRRDGLTTDSFSQRVTAITQAGDVLFGGTGGLLVLRPERMLTLHPVAAPVLAPSEIEEDGRIVPFDPRTGSRTIRSDGHGIRIAFALSDYAAPEEIRYRYRLRGFDQDWVEIPQASPATAIYTNLPGGAYILELQAQIPGVHPRVVTTRLDLIVARAWHEWWWVRLALLAIAVLAIVGIVQLRTVVLRRRTRMLETVVGQQTQELRAANARLELLASTDPLTVLANRRTMIALLDTAREAALQSGRTYVVAMLDIDLFKRINDAHGHQVGDLVIEAVAGRIAGAVRAVDVVARYGGEEIAILFADVSPQEALATTERVRTAVAESPIVANGVAVQVTVSGGIALATGETPPAELLHRADLALYQAKRDGRNRVVLDDRVAVEASGVL
ncbi:ligand-binding sensor domain-containing diguanylate cyclase [uncultured Sphingomonas sp.]|uniref:ligand-binding sensor domain-containing diguanylate cyclase n=1 Tax=uncultured Sphingomonas sp. TaxID=158754 RepID=UPI0025E03C00|nr:ligand-binding sensor domain-containing diguanylate cyclase [uncultured Sphingomonas sp.]